MNTNTLRTRYRRALALGPCVGLAICLGLSLSASADDTASDPEDAELVTTYSHAPYARLLAVSIHDGLVDYAIAAEHRHELDAYLTTLAQTGPQSTPEQFPANADRLAYYLNAYNAFMLQLVLDHAGDQTDGTHEVDLAWFDSETFTLDDQTVTLNHLEHTLIRGAFPDPRIHFALVCGAESCPPLRTEPFDAQTLNQQLEAQGRDWLAEADGLVLRDDGRIALSRIFEWYAADFEAEGGLVAVLERYVPDDDPRKPAVLAAAREGRVDWLDYDWSVNKTDK